VSPCRWCSEAALVKFQPAVCPFLYTLVGLTLRPMKLKNLKQNMIVSSSKFSKHGQKAMFMIKTGHFGIQELGFDV
jgi:hypothetical protein